MVNLDKELIGNILNSLRQDIIDLGKPGLQTTYKLTVTSRMERIYDCLLPSLKRK
jgi:nuclear-control-of-ATPase protein 2